MYWGIYWGRPIDGDYLVLIRVPHKLRRHPQCLCWSLKSRHTTDSCLKLYSEVAPEDCTMIFKLCPFTDHRMHFIAAVCLLQTQVVLDPGLALGIPNVL